MSTSEAKARLYKTAQFTTTTRGFWPHLTADPVRVRFMHVERNHLHNCHEPVYACYADMADESLIGTYFERALERFVL